MHPSRILARTYNTNNPAISDRAASFSSSVLFAGDGVFGTVIDISGRAAKPRPKERISYRDALLIGVAQACAAMPGLSRSGSTIATGILLGNKKTAVAQFSFLMVLAPILGETLLEAVSGELTAGIGTGPLVAGFLASFITGCLACRFMLEIVKRGRLIWFALYCALAGVISIASYLF